MMMTMTMVLRPPFARAFFLSPILSSSKSPLLSTTTTTTTTLHLSTKAKIIFLGTPDVAADSLKAIVEYSQKEEDCGYEVVGVVTQPPKRRKRRGKVVPSPVGIVAEDFGIPVLCPEKAKDTTFLDTLEHDIRPDMCITAAYGQYLPKRFLQIPKFGTLNIHPSLLPRWRGASPVQRSLEAGDNPVGVSVLYTVSKMDAGPIVTQESVTIDENDQAGTVLPQLFDIGTRLLLSEAIPMVLSGQMTFEKAQPQHGDDATAAAMIDSSEGELRVWEQDATTCHNKVRGFSMWPGTFLYLQIGDSNTNNNNNDDVLKLKVIETRVVLVEEQEEDNDESLTQTVVLPKQKGAGLRVVCYDGSVLELLQVQPVTKNVMDAKSFVNGLRGQTITWIETPKGEEE